MQRTNYKEKDFQTDFNKWLKHVYRQSGAFELKVSPTDSLPFEAVKEHQENALFLSEHGSIVYKIPDDSMQQKPFDCFQLVGVPGHVVVMFNSKERGQKEFFMIPVQDWLQEKQNSVRRSLTVDRAREIGTVCHLHYSPN